MRKVLPLSRIGEMEPDMDARVLRYIHEGQIEAFEGFEDFDLIAFDWYDVRSERTAASQMLLYLDREDLFVFCEDEAALGAAQGVFRALEEEGTITNQQALCHFFTQLLRGDMDHLDRLEAEVNDGETDVLSGTHGDYLERIIAWRGELLRLKRYYEQLDSIFDELSMNDNGLMDRQSVRQFTNLGYRMTRYLNAVQSLRESVAQLREAYQSQLSIQQNDLMKIFTVVTAVFLPLTLLAGWYGMNFANMPELRWKYGYPAVILVSAAVVIGLLWYFKRKKWLCPPEDLPANSCKWRPRRPKSGRRGLSGRCSGSAAGRAFAALAAAVTAAVTAALSPAAETGSQCKGQPRPQSGQDQQFQHGGHLTPGSARRCGKPQRRPPRRWRTGSGPRRRPSSRSPAPASPRRWRPHRGCTAG